MNALLSVLPYQLVFVFMRVISVQLDPQRCEGARCVFQLQGHMTPVRTVAFSPDGLALVSGGVGGLLNIWSMRVSVYHGRRLHKCRLTYSPNKQTSKDSPYCFHDDTLVCMFTRVGWISAADCSCWIWSDSQHSLDP